MLRKNHIIIQKNVYITPAHPHSFVIEQKERMNTATITERLLTLIKNGLSHLGIPMHVLDRFDVLIYIIIIAGISFLAAEIVYRIALGVSKRIQKHREYTFLARLMEHNALRKQSHIIPPLIMNTLLPFAFANRPVLLHYMEDAVWIYFCVAVTMAVTAILSSLGETAFSNGRYHNRPIKGFVQIARMVVYIVSGIVIISILTGKSPVYLIGGLGAFAAVLMLITKDSILGFVGGYLLLENDMVRIGDWIEVPGDTINGTVTDISLTIVKVQNFDNTIATIPPYTLINNSFINWRGMSDSGGRRIARGYTVKLDNITPCDSVLIGRVKRLSNEFAKQADAAAAAGNPLPETNAGLFRMYAEIFLQQHPSVRSDMTIMVRTLAPTDSGLPIQFYCFTATTDWLQYERIQADIMEHFASVMPLFGLYPFQSSSARDTIISGLLEGQYPINRIKGLPNELHNDD